MGSAESYFRYARDKAFIDMVGHQGNDFWAELNRLTAEFDAPGRFLHCYRATNGRETLAWAAIAISCFAIKAGLSAPPTSCSARSKARIARRY